MSSFDCTWRGGPGKRVAAVYCGARLRGAAMFFNKDADGKGSPLVKRRTVPLLPLRDIIVFPHMVSQLFVGRERSINALDAAMARDKDIFLAAQKNAKTNEPTPEDIFAVGTLGTVMQLLRLPDGTVKVLVEGKRAREDQALRPDRRVLPRRGRRDRGGVAARRRGRGADAQRAGRLRALREAEQEGSARSLDERADDRRSGAPLATRSSRTCRPSSSPTASSSSRRKTPRSASSVCTS